MTIYVDKPDTLETLLQVAWRTGEAVDGIGDGLAVSITPDTMVAEGFAHGLPDPGGRYVELGSRWACLHAGSRQVGGDA